MLSVALGKLAFNMSASVHAVLPSEPPIVKEKEFHSGLYVQFRGLPGDEAHTLLSRQPTGASRMRPPSESREVARAQASMGCKETRSQGSYPRGYARAGRHPRVLRAYGIQDRAEHSAA